MDEYLETNRRRWDEAVPVHLRSSYYDIASFKAGMTSLKPLEIDELGDVSGRSLLHLQCHFGLDTLSWARLGARVTGADFSPAAIEAARSLAAETGIEARFIESDVYSLPDRLDGQFDIVYTSYGVLFWLPDMEHWAKVVSHFLRPGGTFYIVEFHPFSGIFDKEEGLEDLQVTIPYFPQREPLRFEDDEGTYADRTARYQNKVTYSWPHPLSEVVSALIDAGLRIEFLHEFPFSTEPVFPFMEQGGDGYYRLTKHDGSVPLLFSIKAMKV